MLPAVETELRKRANQLEPLFRRLLPQGEITAEERERGLKALIWDGVCSSTMASLTGGVFLTAYALELGLSSSYIGLMAALPLLTQLTQLPGVVLVEQLRTRKLICVTASSLARLMWLWIAVLPFTGSTELISRGVLFALFVNGVFVALSNVSWNSWLHDFLPHETLGRFFSKRLRYSMVASMSAGFLAGAWLDYWRSWQVGKEVFGYSFLFAAGFLAGAVGVRFLSKIPEPYMAEGKTDWRDIFTTPFEDLNFRNLLAFNAAWNFALNLVGPFFAVYMLDVLKLPLKLVVLLTICNQLFSLVAFRWWGTLADRYSFKTVLNVCVPLHVVALVGWTFTTLPEKHFFTLPLLFILHGLMGITTAGANLAQSSIALKLAPPNQGTPFLAANNAVIALASGVAPIIGGRFADMFANMRLSMTIQWSSPGRELELTALDFHHWDFFFLLGALLGLYGLHRLAFIREKGEVPREILMEELVSVIGTPIRNFSTANGIRNVFLAPLHRVLKGKETGESFRGSGTGSSEEP